MNPSNQNSQGSSGKAWADNQTAEIVFIEGVEDNTIRPARGPVVFQTRPGPRSTQQATPELAKPEQNSEQSEQPTN
jgi:hypothetical protein